MGSTPFPPVAPPQGGKPNLPVPGQPGPMKDGDFGPSSIPYLTTFSLDKVTPPSTVYMQKDDQITINAMTELAGGDTLTFVFRFLLAAPDLGGQPDSPPKPATPGSRIGFTQTIKTITQTLNLTQRVLSQLTFQVSEGYLLSIGVSGLNSVIRGQTFASVRMVRRVGATGNLAQVLCADYVTNVYGPGFPGGAIHQAAEGPGQMLSTNIVNPAAGADFFFPCPANTRWRPVSLQATFTASAAAANRQVQVQVDDGGNNYWTQSAAANITAGQVATVSITGVNAPTGIVALDFTILIPPALVIPAGHRIKTNTVAIQAGDQWSAIQMLTEQWLDL